MPRYVWPAAPGQHDDPEGRAAYRSRYRPTAEVRRPDGGLDPQPKRRRRRAAPKAAPSAIGKDLWLPIGPSEVARGQAESRPNVSGRIRDLQVDTVTGSNRVYAASAGGGVWFSADSGETWRPLDEFAVSPNRSTLTPVGAALACGALYVRFGAAASGSQDEVWVGTGEPRYSTPDGNPGGSLMGVGVLHAVGPATGTAWSFDDAAGAFRGKSFWRITASPLDPAHLFAATSAGLFHRPPGRPWTAFGDLGDGRNDEPIDIAVTSTGSGTTTALRIWVVTWKGMHVGRLALPLPDPPDDLPEIDLDGVDLDGVAWWTNKKLAVGSGNRLWVLGRRTNRDAEKYFPAHLWRVDTSAASPAGVGVSGVPAAMFGGDGNDQSAYDMCIAAHPEAADTMLVGGAGVRINGHWQAAIYRLVVAGPAATPTATPTWVGRGVHADVHILRIGARFQAALPDRVVWTGCDGGVFRSVSDGDNGSFLERNSELATLEPGYLACHPTNPGIVAAGMQDNGTCVRRGDMLWELAQMGDGGGTVYDPAHDNRYVTQYLRSSWSTSTGAFTQPVLRSATKSASEKEEDENSIFYSGAAALAHGGVTHLLIGTDRPWHSTDWGQTWATIPAGKDPRAGANPNVTQDRLDPSGWSRNDGSTESCSGRFYRGVLSTRLSRADASDGTVRIRAHALWGNGLNLFLGTAPAVAGGKWAWTNEVALVIRKPSGGEELNAVAVGGPMLYMPAAGLVSDVAVHDPERGAHGSCYVTTIGSTDPLVDTVWWYDGDVHFYPCGVRHTAPGRGLWLDGRIVAPAMSVIVDPEDPNVVFVGTSIGVIRGVLSFTPATLQPQWNWRQYDGGLPETAVNDLAIFQDGEVRVLRAALHGRGLYEIDLTAEQTAPRTYLRVYPTDTRKHREATLIGPAAQGEASTRFDDSPDVVVDDSPAPVPARGFTEAELWAMRGAQTTFLVAATHTVERHPRVHVLVHHRWPRGTSDIRVFLLRKELPGAVANPTVNGLWPALVTIAGGGATPNPLPDGWVRAGSVLLQQIAGPADALRPRTATFEMDLSAHPGGRMMLLAVVSSADDPLTANENRKPDGTACTTVSELVLNSRHVAARSLELI